VALSGELVPASPDCAPDGAGGFDVGGSGSRRRLPVLRLTADPGAGALIAGIESAANEQGYGLAVIAYWRSRLEGKLVARGETATVEVPALIVGDAPLVLSLRARIRYHDVNPYTQQPTLNVTRSIDIAASVRLAPAEAPPPTPHVQEMSVDPDRGHDAAPGQGTQQDQELRTMPAQQPPAVRRLAEGDVPHKGWAAVDFGTTNTTVTLYDDKRLELVPMPAAQEGRLRSELAVLLKAPAPAAARAGWQTLLAATAQRLLGPPADTGDAADADAAGTALASGLTEGSKPLSPHAVYTDIQTRLPSAPEETQRYAASALHNCYDLAFQTPPLQDSLRLFPVDLEHNGGEEIPSIIEVTQTEPELRVRVGEQLASAVAPSGQPDEPLVFFSRKKYLGQKHQEPELPAHADGSPSTSDDLIREALRFVLDQTDTYITDHPSELKRGQVDHVVVTYPTIAPPAVRKRLRELLNRGTAEDPGLGVTIVQSLFDEAIAAALFGLMRDFGGDARTGVQVFRTRCRPVPGSDRHWQQNVLVADIGGGTTDIALVKLGLREDTPDLGPGSDSRFTGRRYVVTPTLLGSTGALQLGGERMTLRLFTWFKAAFADYLLVHDGVARYAREIGALQPPYTLKGQYVPGSLCHEAALSATDYPHNVVDLVLRTRWKSVPDSERPDVEQTFWLLWRIAEEAKIELGGGAPEYAPEPQQVADILRRTRAEHDGPGTGATDGEPEDEWSPTLYAADFEALMAPILREITELAVPLVSQSLSGNGATGAEPEVLDRILLTGKSSAMPIVRREFQRALDADNVITWNLADLTVEHDYAKLATSVGAAWGEHIRRYAFTTETSRRALELGRWELEIEVDNLRYNLPARFLQMAQTGAGADLELLQARTPLTPTGSGGRWVARTQAWYSPQLDVTIRRETRPGVSEPWGVFKYESHVEEDGEAKPPFFDKPDLYRKEVRFQLEMDIDLIPRLFLTRALAPDYEVPRSLGTEVNFRRAADGSWLPVQIVVNPQVAGDRPARGEIVFDLPRDPADAAAASSGTEDRFDRSFYPPASDADDDGDEAAPPPSRRAMLGRTRLPAPAGNAWSFYLRYADQPDVLEDIDQLPVPGAGAGEGAPERAEYVATLDEDMYLAVHRAEIPYRKATTLTDMWENPGSVLEVAMSGSYDGPVADYDPFNGNH
jgi:molecular chaperone DnaK (HSP70)